MQKIKLLALVGPTASGKTRLAVELAKRFSGEIISADSMQIYRTMNIATAKPTVEEMAGIPHHLIDCLDPEEAFSVSDYVSLAREKIREIHGRGHLPILAGGTGLYIDSVVQHVTFSEQPEDPRLREELYRQAKKDQGKELYESLCRIDPQAAEQIHPHNFVRLVRAVEVYRLTGKTLTQHKEKSRREPSPYETCMIGLNATDRQFLYDRIDLRVDLMMKAGLLEEARKVLFSKHLKTAWNAIGYKELKPYFDGAASLDECIGKIKQESRRYAKRQLTWFRRNPQIHWVYIDECGTFEDVIKNSQKYVESFFNL